LLLALERSDFAMLRRGSRAEKTEAALDAGSDVQINRALSATSMLPTLSETANRSLSSSSLDKTSLISHASKSVQQQSNPPKLTRVINAKPSFHKINTIDNIFAVFYGFQSGQLLVQVLEARRIPGQDQGQFFCELCVEKKKEKTQILVRESTCWNEEFCFDLHESTASPVRVSIFQKKKMMKAKEIGHVQVEMSSLVDGNIHEGWYSIVPTKPEKHKDGIGELFLKLQYTSETKRNRDYLLSKEHYAKLMECLLLHDLVILSSLCRVYESEELSKAIIRLFNAEGHALRLLIQLIYRDLKATVYEDILFRNDSMATKTTRNYFKLIGSDYLRTVLSAGVKDVLLNPKGYEVDSSKLISGNRRSLLEMTPPDSRRSSEVSVWNIEDNKKRLWTISQLFLDSILDSVDKIPLNMRKFFNLLRQLVRQCFPQKELKSIGAFLFLRFLVPAIISPTSYGVIEEPIDDMNAIRALTLIGKILQNLANELKDFKEDYMVFMNPFLSTNLNRIHEFYEKASIVPETGGIPDSFRPKLTQEDKIKCLSLIVGQLERNIDLVEKRFADDPRISASDTLEENREKFGTLKRILQLQPSIQAEGNIGFKEIKTHKTSPIPKDKSNNS